MKQIFKLDILLTLLVLSALLLFPAYGICQQSSGTTINGVRGPFTFSGSGVSCNLSTFTCTFTGTGTGLGSISWTVPSFMSASPATLSSSGTQTFSFNSQLQNLFLASPDGSSGVPSFRSITPTDLPLGSSSQFGALKCGSGTSCSAGVISATGTGTGNMNDGAGSSTSGYFPLTTTTLHTYLVGANLNDGVDAPNTLTYKGTGGITASAGPIKATGATVGLVLSAGTAATGAAGNVVYATDATNGYAEVNENNTGLSRVCTAANGVCPAGTGTVTDGAGTTTAGQVLLSTTTAHTYSINATLPVASGGTGTATPSLVAGTGISVTGTWPNQTVGNLVADTTFATATTAVAANSCDAAATTVTMTGLTTSMTVTITPSTDVSGTTGWSPAAAGQLYFTAWPSAANTLSYKRCNPTSASITPGAATWNVSAR